MPFDGVEIDTVYKHRSRSQYTVSTSSRSHPIRNTHTDIPISRSLHSHIATHETRKTYQFIRTMSNDSSTACESHNHTVSDQANGGELDQLQASIASLGASASGQEEPAFHSQFEEVDKGRESLNDGPTSSDQAASEDRPN